jgi:hypothetical protein
LDGAELVLNGTATRTFFGIRVYEVGLYLNALTNDGAEIMGNNAGPKRLKILLHRAVPEAKFVSAVRDNLDRNLTVEEQEKFAAELLVFFQTFENAADLNRGAEVVIDYLPSEGTVVMVDGQKRTLIPGREFYHTLLRLWIGNPLQSSIKTGLLGVPSSK